MRLAGRGSGSDLPSHFHGSRRRAAGGPGRQPVLTIRFSRSYEKAKLSRHELPPARVRASKRGGRNVQLTDRRPRLLRRGSRTVCPAGPRTAGPRQNCRHVTRRVRQPSARGFDHDHQPADGRHSNGSLHPGGRVRGGGPSAGPVHRRRGAAGLPQGRSPGPARRGGRHPDRRLRPRSADRGGGHGHRHEARGHCAAPFRSPSWRRPKRTSSSRESRPSRSWPRPSATSPCRTSAPARARSRFAASRPARSRATSRAQGGGGHVPRRVGHLLSSLHARHRLVRHESRRGAAGSAGHAVRVGLAGRHGALHQQPARAQHDELLRRADRKLDRRRQSGGDVKAGLQRAARREGRGAGGRLLRPLRRLHGRRAAGLRRG